MKGVRSFVLVFVFMAAVLFAMFSAANGDYQRGLAQPGFVSDMAALNTVRMALGAACAAMALTAAAIAVTAYVKLRRRTKLRAYGIRVTATVTAVEMNTSIAVNRRHPWVVTARCTHPRTGEEVTLRSQNLWKTSLGPGDHVSVAFEPTYGEKYVMDVEEA